MGASGWGPEEWTNEKTAPSMMTTRSFLQMIGGQCRGRSGRATAVDAWLLQTSRSAVQELLDRVQARFDLFDAGGKRETDVTGGTEGVTGDQGDVSVFEQGIAEL